MVVLVVTKEQYGGEMWMNSRKNHNREKHNSQSPLTVSFFILLPVISRTVKKKSSLGMQPKILHCCCKSTFLSQGLNIYVFWEPATKCFSNFGEDTVPVHASNITASSVAKSCLLSLAHVRTKHQKWTPYAALAESTQYILSVSAVACSLFDWNVVSSKLF